MSVNTQYLNQNTSNNKLSLIEEYKLLSFQAWDLKQLDPEESDFLEYQALLLLQKIKFMFG
ncbi:hypothetical protein [Mesonia aestuariivivens]|uniref:Uncharacterized protein n=1 Tax=Mesonia aestuariivivens TaxID=2796128 RepID=A0ABS6W6B2_9FLAO|nr:hypothetical protein [Mesonia aestuariivivens]MBW2963026.1 hypothetical protein [Mesonia aestuariivivens]